MALNGPPSDPLNSPTAVDSNDDGLLDSLYTGDLGASLGQDYREVPDFDAHIPLMEGFHRRYMSSTAALRAWVGMARTLDVQIIAPQHGALFRGEMVGQFYDWLETLECGIDAMADVFKVPA